jgi:hypothetical protein
MGKISLQGLRTIVVLAALTLTGYVSVAQVSAYVFSQSTGTYSAISGGATIATTGN